jgi:hypothetical protein
MLVIGLPLATVAVALSIAVHHWYSLQAQRNRDAIYQRSLQSYLQEFPSGLERKTVEDRLRVNKTQIQQLFNARSLNAFTDLVRIGQDPAPWYCSDVGVYIAFDFAATEQHPSDDSRDSDVLRRVRLEKHGEECL